MGTMAFGGDADDVESERMFAAARDAGVNFFDCADVYNGGRAESILGRLMKGSRDQLVVTSKAYFPTGEGPNQRGSSRYHLVSAVEASLRRLETDRIDVFFLHRFDDLTSLHETMRALDDLVRQGKILYLGASNFAAWQVVQANAVAELNGWERLVCVQPMYNLAKRQAEVELLPMSLACGLGVVTYSPVGGGLFSGRYGTSKQPAKGRLVDNAMYRTRYGDPAYLELADGVCGVADELGVSPVSLAVSWVSSHQAVTSPIVGGRSVDQLRPALASVDLEMTSELRARLSAMGRAPSPATDRNEEATGDNYSNTLSKELDSK
jgi:aryl-alcohol dehydrogenase-like predicted oxidoreductase